MVEYDIINLTKKQVPELSELPKVIDYTLDSEHINNAIFNIIIIDNPKIKELNRDYRQKDDFTDVISFALEDHKDNIKSAIRVLGDVYISIDQAEIQAIEYNHSLKRELSFLTVHGLLHLLGYDHQNKTEETNMKNKTEVILNAMEIFR